MKKITLTKKFSRVCLWVPLYVDIEGDEPISDESVVDALVYTYGEIVDHIEIAPEWEVVDSWEVDANGNIRG